MHLDMFKLLEVSKVQAGEILREVACVTWPGRLSRPKATTSRNASPCAESQQTHSPPSPRDPKSNPSTVW